MITEHMRVKPIGHNAPVGIVLMIAGQEGGRRMAKVYYGTSDKKVYNEWVDIANLEPAPLPVTGPAPLEMLGG